jgi:predicted hydrocarbon binding protein
MIPKEAIDPYCGVCGVIFDYTMTMRLVQEFPCKGLGHVQCPVCETFYEYRFEEGILVSFEQCPEGSLFRNRTAEDVIADLKG